MLDFATREQQYIALFILALVLLRIPKVGRFFRVVNTLFHEDGHAIIALLTSGSVDKINLFADTSGTCVYRPKNKIAEFLVLLAGYVASSASAYGMFWFLHHQHNDWFLYSFAGVLGLNLILWVRNKYGVFWILFFGLLIAACIYLQNNILNFYFLFFISALNLVESVYSTLVILYVSAEEPSQAGDARGLRQLTFIPAIIWALLFVAQAGFFTVLVLEMLFGIQLI